MRVIRLGDVVSVVIGLFATFLLLGHVFVQCYQRLEQESVHIYFGASVVCLLAIVNLSFLDVLLSSDFVFLGFPTGLRHG